MVTADTDSVRDMLELKCFDALVLLMRVFHLIHAPLLCLMNSIFRVVFFGRVSRYFCHTGVRVQIFCVSSKIYMCVTFNIIMNLLEYIISFVGL